jgi:ATP-dependent exoDNAse (exonuclease V) beta subunit
MVLGTKIHSYLEKLNKNQICLDQIPPAYKQHILNYIDFLKIYKLPLPTYTENKYETEFDSIKFNGIIDAVYVQGDRAIVVDYKSGREHSNLSDYRFELQLYSYMIEKNLNLKVVKYGIFFTKSKLFLFETNDFKYQDILTTITKVKNKIAEKQFKELNQSLTCNMCSFKQFCKI